MDDASTGGGIYTHKAETKRRAHRQRRRVHGRACHPAEHALTSDSDNICKRKNVHFVSVAKLNTYSLYS
jgi:hypothetical protein